jgi:ElaB/YqjD/DUF883 family membrane-anchored ribosome-binding protein
MADKPDDSRREIEKGRQDVADTRSALTEKLAILEDRVQGTVEAVKHTVDLHYQVNQRPWLMIGASLLVGYTLGHRGSVSSTTADTSREPSARAQPPHSIAREVTSQVQDNLASIKVAAMGAVISTLWAMAKQVLLPAAQKADGANVKPRVLRVDSSPQIPNRDQKVNGREISSLGNP